MAMRWASILIVGACTGMALAKANKIKVFTAEPVQIDETVAALGPAAEPDGMAILNYIEAPDKSIVQVMINSMTPQTTYSLRLTDGTGDVTVFDALTTDDDGNATFHSEFEGMDLSLWDVEVFVGATVSGTVWSQVPDPGNPPAELSNTSLDITGRAADSFAFANDATVTEVHWWGAWCGNGAPLIESFRVRIYDNLVVGDNGSLDNIVFEETVVPSSNIATGISLPCGAGEHAYQANLSTPFAATGGTTYWIEIVGVFDTVTGGVFNVSNASSAGGFAEPDGDGAGVQWVLFNPPIWTAGHPDRAFELVGESGGEELRLFGENLN